MPKLIEGPPPPDTPKQRVIDEIKAMRKQSVRISCHRCGGCEVIVVLLGAMLKGGKLVGGTKQVLCGSCFMKGERVVLV